jgi:uncharacterized membrane protein
MLDLVLAIGHHLLIFGILFAEFLTVRPGLELMLFVLLPIFAAAMARGYGEF